MRNTYTAAARAAHAPGDDTLARALKEALNSRTVRGCPSGHKCIPLARPPGKHFLRTHRVPLRTRKEGEEDSSHSVSFVILKFV